MLLLFTGIYRILADFGFLTTTTTGDLLWLASGLLFGIMPCNVLSHVGQGSIENFDSMSIE